MTTAIAIIRPALRRIGAVGATEQPTAKQIAIGLELLNGLIDTWSVLPQTSRPVETVVSLNAATLTIGPGQQINVVRPMRIESAYSRVSGLDQDIRVETKQVYDSIDQKSTNSTWPELLWYDQGTPTGIVHFWPIPQASVELHITTRLCVQPYALAEDDQNLPGGYLRALQLALAVESGSSFNVPVSATLMQDATNAFNAITPQNFTVPELSTDRQVSTRLGQFLSGC
jgi:hypothetical protein